MDILVLKTSKDIRGYCVYRSLQLEELLKKEHKHTNVVDLNIVEKPEQIHFDTDIIVLFDWVNHICNEKLQRFINNLSYNHNLYYTGRIALFFEQFVNIHFPEVKKLILNEDFSCEIPRSYSFFKNPLYYPRIPVLTSKGCNGSCSFCSNRIINSKLGITNKWDSIDYSKVLEYISQSSIICSNKKFVFIDNNFVGDWNKSKIFFYELKELKINYFAETRVDSLMTADFDLLKQSGLKKVSLGLESGSDTVLNRMNKKQTVTQSESAIKTLKSYGILLEPFFIMFTPDISFSEIGENLDFIGRNELYKTFHSSSLLTKQYLFDRANPLSGFQFVYNDDRVAMFEQVLINNQIKDIRSKEDFDRVISIYNSIK